MKKTFLLISTIVVVIIGGIAAYTINKNANVNGNTNSVYQNANSSVNSQAANSNTAPTSNQNTNAVTPNISWEFNGTAWQASETPTACPSPLVIASPVDATKATAILYPGQTRGGNYKAHGGFIFRGLKNTEVTVTAPMDAVVVQGARYIEQGEVQYLFDLQNPCGIRFRFDHLLTLSPAFQALADQLPLPVKDDSRTQKFTTPLSVKSGDTIATAVGFIANANVSVDFGVYDLRQKNTASQNASWAASHSAELAQYAVCWLDLLSSATGTQVKALPGGDQSAGKTSDFCK